MRISEMIEALQRIMEEEGNLQVTYYDEFMAEEGYDYDHEELWVPATPYVDWVKDNSGKKIRKVVCFDEAE